MVNLVVLLVNLKMYLFRLANSLVFLHHKEKNLLRLCIEARTMLIARVLETYIVGFDEKEDLRSVLMYAYLFFDRNYECELSFGSSAKKHL